MLSGVRWYESIKQLMELQDKKIIEVGPGKILKGLMLQIDNSLSVFSTFNQEELQNTIKQFT